MAVRTQQTCRPATANVQCPRGPLRINLRATTADKDLPLPPPMQTISSNTTKNTPIISPDPTAAKSTYPPTPADASALLSTAQTFRSNATTWAIADALYKATEPITCTCCECACMPAPNRWSFTIPVPLPDGADFPTLREVKYMAGYSTAHAGGAAFIQTDLLMTTRILRHGVCSVGEDTALQALYMDDYLATVPQDKGHTSAPPPPQMLDPAEALSLYTTFSTAAVKEDGSWSRYLESVRVSPDVRVSQGAHVYLVVHLTEFPTAELLRTFHVRVAATWQRKEVEEAARAEAERKAREERERLEAERRAQEQERRERARARDEARVARREEREERLANAQFREEFLSMAKRILESKQRSDLGWPFQMTLKMEMGGKPDKCPQGYTWKQTETGFVCEGGSHKIDVAQPE